MATLKDAKQAGEGDAKRAMDWAKRLNFAGTAAEMDSVGKPSVAPAPVAPAAAPAVAPAVAPAAVAPAAVAPAAPAPASLGAAASTNPTWSASSAVPKPVSPVWPTGQPVPAAAPATPAAAPSSLAYRAGRAVANSGAAKALGSANTAVAGATPSVAGAALSAVAPTALAVSQGWADPTSAKSRFMNDPNVSTLEKAKQFGADAYNIVLPSAGGVIGAGAGAGLASVPLAIGGGVVGAGAAKALDAGLGLESGQTDAFRKYATPPPAAAPAPAPTAAPAQQKTVEQNTAQNLAPFGAQAQVRAVDNAITERQQNGVGTINPVSVDPNDPSFKGKMAQAGYENMLKNQEMSKQQAWRASPLGSLAGALGSSASLRIGQAGENRVRKEAVQDTELGIKAANANNSAANTKRGMDSDAEKVGGDHLKRATTIFTDPKKGPEYNQAVEAGAIGMLAGAGLSPGKATEAQREAAIHHSSIAQKIHEANKSNWLSPSSKGVPRNRDSIAPSSLKDGIYETPSGPVKAKDLTGEELAQMDALLADAKKNQKASLQDGRK